jgi:hypothetical protein
MTETVTSPDAAESSHVSESIRLEPSLKASELFHELPAGLANLTSLVLETHNSRGQVAVLDE